MTSPIVSMIGIGSSLAGGIVSGIGQKSQYEAQAGMYGYQAKVSQLNSKIDLQNADYAIRQGEKQALIKGMEGGQEYAKIVAAQGASNIAVGSGSGADVLSSQRKITSMDLDTIRSNAAKTAYDYRVQSVQDLNQAGLYQMASANAQKAGKIALAGSLISTAGSVSSKWLSASQSGMFNTSSSEKLGGTDDSGTSP